MYELKNNEMNFSENDAAMLLKFSRENPGALPEEILQLIAKFAIIQDGANRIIATADIHELKEHFPEWTKLFLDSRNSEQTRRAYERAINLFLKFCEAENVEPVTLKYSDAVKFSQSPYLTKKQGCFESRAPESIRRDLAAVSSFYTELTKFSDSKINNPFIRLENKPKKQLTHIKNVPDADELETILKNTSGIVKAAIYIMAKRGLRVGALKYLHLQSKEGRTFFNTLTKGKEQTGELTADIVECISAAGLQKIKPFSELSTPNLTMKIERALDKLAAAGLITGQEAELKVNGKIQTRQISVYSCHSFRHFFAVSEYKKDRDIERLRKLLNHADISTTQCYLQSLGLIFS